MTKRENPRRRENIEKKKKEIENLSQCNNFQNFTTKFLTSFSYTMYVSTLKIKILLKKQKPARKYLADRFHILSLSRFRIIYILQ